MSSAEPFAKVLAGTCRSGTGKRSKGLYNKYKFDEIQQCRDRCLQNGDDCTGIEYHRKSKRCEVHKTVVTHAAASDRNIATCEVRCGPLVNQTCTVAPPRTSPCNKILKIGDGRCNVEKLATLRTRSIRDCIKRCQRSARCRGYEFAHNWKMCTLYSELPTQSRIRTFPGFVCFALDCY